MFGSYGVIPNPSGLTESGEKIIIGSDCGITYGKEMEKAGVFLTELLGIEKTESGFISFLRSAEGKNPEEYYLNIGKDGIIIESNSEEGFFYGAQTLRQLFPASVEKGGLSEDLQLPCLKIHDYPRFGYRGFMLDCARHFFDVETIKITIDLMALHKMNRFHWHLTDDQGFRIQIDRYPLLTEVGSKRKKSQISGNILCGKKKYDSKPHEGYYTKDEIREIVDYAGKNCIEVIPELDIPGHSTAILASYPEYSCSEKPIEAGTSWGIYKNLICAGKESSYDFIANILDEILPLFPYRHIHLGGDETPMSQWKKCPNCQTRIKENNLKGTHELKAYFLNRVMGYLKSRDFNVIVWDDAACDELSKDAIVQYWSPFGEKRSKDSLSAGRKMIVSPFIRYYLDYTYKMIPLRKTYEYNPVSMTDSDIGEDLILGVEAPLWTEYISSNERLFWQMFPRLSAISEVAWSGERSSSYENFIARFRKLSLRLPGHASPACYGYDGISVKTGLIFSKEPISDLEFKKYNPD